MVDSACFFEKTQNDDLFILPNLEMSLKSSIMSKLDHQMSKIWIEFAGPGVLPGCYLLYHD